MHGFLGTGASFQADLNLVVQIAMGLALIAGMMLVRKKKFRAHKYCQSSVMILNLAMIFLIMSPSFHHQVEPNLPRGLGENYYLIATVHAALGAAAELLGLYIVLVAATKLLPERLRFRRYKPWMRTALALWWATILLGTGTYYFWYVAPTPKVETPQMSAPAQEKRVTVRISNNKFEPRELTVEQGTVIEWIDEMGRHTVEADDRSFASPELKQAERFERRFDEPGTYQYFCGYHGDKGGVDMSGVITVTPRAK
jgi:plastocyanin